MCIASKVGNVVDIAEEAIDHGKVSVPFLIGTLRIKNVECRKRW